MASTTTHHLLLLRHAKAVGPSDVPDHERPLAPRGRRDAPPVGEWLASQGLVPDLVLCSDAARAAETAELVVSALVAALPEAARERPPVRAVPELYEASVHGALHLVAASSEDVDTLLVVGHEPTTSALVAALTGRRVSFPTAAVAVVELDGTWSEVAGGTGRLVTVH